MYIRHNEPMQINADTTIIVDYSKHAICDF